MRDVLWLQRKAADVLEFRQIWKTMKGTKLFNGGLEHLVEMVEESTVSTGAMGPLITGSSQCLGEAALCGVHWQGHLQRTQQSKVSGFALRNTVCMEGVTGRSGCNIK